MSTFAFSDTIITTLPDSPVSLFITHTFAIFNVLLCLSIVWRLFTFQRKGSRHRLAGGVIAMHLMGFYMWTPILFVLGRVAIVDWATVGINCIVFIAIFRARGNVMQLFKS
jgi:hypothetical protein|nr:MAG TPA: hypothetical protein [Caudoviricetes sp.]